MVRRGSLSCLSVSLLKKPLCVTNWLDPHMHLILLATFSDHALALLLCSRASFSLIERTFMTVLESMVPMQFHVCLYKGYRRLWIRYSQIARKVSLFIFLVLISLGIKTLFWSKNINVYEQTNSYNCTFSYTRVGFEVTLRILTWIDMVRMRLLFKLLGIVNTKA